MQEWLDRHNELFPLIFPLYLVSVWILVSFVISLIGGWYQLQRNFRLREKFDGTQWTFQSGKMRSIAGYRNCLVVGANPRGLFLGTLVLFRAFHPNLLIPWEQVSFSRRKLLFFNYGKFELGREERIPLTVSLKLAEKVRDAAGSNWPPELPYLSG
jgi:hypothetical protein